MKNLRFIICCLLYCLAASNLKANNPHKNVDPKSNLSELVCVPLSAPWSNADIGSVGAAGSACVEDGVYHVEASGADIWGGSDEFHFVHQSLSGDGEIIARVVSLENTNQWAKAGIMMRNTTDANSAMVLAYLSPNPNSNGISYNFSDRPTTGHVMTPSANNIGPVATGGYPYYLRIVREGNTFTAYASASNGNWTLIGSKTIAMNTTIEVGLCTSSVNDGVLASAVYDNVSVLPATTSSVWNANSADIYFNSGNVGIGTTTPDQKLAVNGTVHAKEVLVDIVGWPDYVFQSDYMLPTLEQVEDHIRTKGHLINIPSATEIEVHGAYLGETNKLLLEKIEELTLYLIDLNRKNKALESRIQALEESGH